MTTTETEGTCFVIMPFRVRKEDLPTYLNDENHWTEVYDGLILPAVDAAKLNCEKDDEDLGSRLIVDEIWEKIEQAELVLCDLSGSNPNVLLELGWALRADKRFVLVKDDVTASEFDTRGFFTFTYSHKLQPSTLKVEINRLKSVIRHTLDDTDKRYSIVRKLSLTAAIEAQPGDTQINMLHEMLDIVRRIDKPASAVVETMGVLGNERGACSQCGHEFMVSKLPYDVFCRACGKELDRKGAVEEWNKRHPEKTGKPSILGPPQI